MGPTYITPSYPSFLPTYNPNFPSEPTYFSTHYMPSQIQHCELAPNFHLFLTSLNNSFAFFNKKPSDVPLIESSLFIKTTETSSFTSNSFLITKHILFLVTMKFNIILNHILIHVQLNMMFKNYIGKTLFIPYTFYTQYLQNTYRLRI